MVSVCPTAKQNKALFRSLCSLKSASSAQLSGLWETVCMADKPRLVEVDTHTYKCSACPNFKVIINPHKKMNAVQIQAQVAKREAQHLKKVHSEDFSQQKKGTPK